jgi:hypothetical protein
VVIGPVAVGGGVHGYPKQASLFDLAPYGWTEQEFFIQGWARSFNSDGSVANVAPYTTRILVRRPIDPTKFNGAVVVDWANVTTGNDLDVAWGFAYPYFLRAGMAYVMVSAQAVGVDNLKAWDPVRYALLEHPGDNFAFDIFSQAIKALKYPGQNATSVLFPGQVDPMGGLQVKRVIATGGSQSATELTTYINNPGIQDRSRLVDAFLPHRGGGPYPNLTTPTLQINEENTFSTLQPDSQHFRLWQEAGDAHAPKDWWQYMSAVLSRDLVGSPLPDAESATCASNRGTAQYDFRAGFYWLNQWLTRGTPPPSLPREIALSGQGGIGGGTPERDANGFAIGGVRDPFIQVPLALNDATGCPTIGHYVPYSAAQIKTLYPTHTAYLSKVESAVASDEKAGYILTPDGNQIIAAAKTFNIWDANLPCFDTMYQDGQDGHVSSITDELAYQLAPEPTGVGADLHELSCDFLTPLGA